MILWNDLFFTVLFIAQTGIGLLGNSILLMLYVSIFVLQPHHKKPIDLILAHLTVNNAMTLLTQVAPGMVLAFSILRLSLNYMKKDDLRLYDPVLFLAGCYAFFCPLVLISSDPHISRFRASSKGGVRHFTSCEFRALWR
ncbi:vomeronasal 1 receptor ornAnaV1R3212 isoform X1 [Ornithorhynchus anatinus]|uniref:vomeronasal 1 receptor ornAnaV1R3212 isoform X1 n=1 Tax=Ornithorhynchus anatinus TaxID=9258 RepID=UPI0019D4CB1A|nr:vomeronasal 1 receptor ornAnaV1R3212 isoform X1 [Ornithorhynchus anatinus]